MVVPPESMQLGGSIPMPVPGFDSYRLRPELIESLVYAFTVTRNDAYRVHAARIVDHIEQQCASNLFVLVFCSCFLFFA